MLSNLKSNIIYTPKELTGVNSMPSMAYFFQKFVLSKQLQRVKNEHREKSILKKIGIRSMQEWTATTRHGITRKRSTKRLSHTGNFIKKKLKLIAVC